MMMKILLFISILTLTIFAKERDLVIKRDPFIVSQNYINDSQQKFLKPVSNYITFELKLLGIVKIAGKEEAVMQLGTGEIFQLGLNDERVIKTPDTKSVIVITHIFDNAIIISVNKGAGVRYEME